MSEEGPVKNCFSFEEGIARAREFMVEYYGNPSGIVNNDDPDKWQEWFGLLVSFLHDLINKRK